MVNANTNYAIADFVSCVNLGIIRGIRCVKINRSNIGARLAHVLYIQGAIRSYKLRPEFIWIYFKLNFSRHILSKLSVVSRPGLRARWNLKKLSQHYSAYNFSGFYIVSTQKGLYTSDYCILEGHMGGEVLIRVHFYNE